MTLASIAAAWEAIAGIAVETPVIGSEILAERAGADVLLKLESLQVTGSFKVRGAARRMLALSDEERARGVVACSSGNHGRAVAYVAELLGIAATICVPEWVDPVKLQAIRLHGAEIVLQGKSYDDAEEASLQVQRERGLAYIHPFDDPLVIEGQGTIGLELLEQVRSLDTVVVPLSGGGLISGIARTVKSYDPGIRVVGVSAVNARVMYESLRAGRPIAFPEPPTIANALSGGIGLDNRYTFRLVRDLVDEHVLVGEDEIREAVAFAAGEHKVIAEGGGAVGIAALLARRFESAGKRIAVVVSGGNVGSDALVEVINSVGAPWQEDQGRTTDKG
ncbi:MAG: threonine/serine dehydratase [Gemmatimonadota bacterium]|nr:MAG: threonine/serine dehydratase [Gemmatimonadota bacterium]